MKRVRGFGFKAGGCRDCGALDTRDSRDTQDSKNSHISADCRASKDCEDSKDTRGIQDSKDSKDSKSGTLALIEKPLRALEQGEVLVKNIAVALNPVDYKLLDFFGAAQEGQIMGLDGVGVVVESRSEVVELGALYAYHADLRGDGSFADLTIMPEKALLPLSNSSLSNHSRNPFTPASLRRMSNTPHSQEEAIAQSNTANTRIVGGEILDSKVNSESTLSDSHSLQNLESPIDSKLPSGGVYLHRDKNQIARSANLKGVVGVGGSSRGEGATSRAVAQPQTHTCTFKPLPP